MTWVTDANKLAAHRGKPVTRGGARGMTLIEVLVATVLLGVGAVGLISVATLATRNQQRTEQRAAALYLAQEMLAEVEHTGAHVWSLGHPMRGTREINRTTYEWTLKIDSLAVGELFGVYVEVRWAAPGGGGDVELETWLNDYEAVALPTVEESSAAEQGAPGFTPPGR